MTQVTTIASHILQLVADQFNFGVSAVTPDSHLYHDLAFDSLDLVELAIELEDEFGIYIDDIEEAGQFTTVQSVIDLVERKRAAQ